MVGGGRSADIAQIFATQKFMDELKRLIELANDRLKNGKIGVSLGCQGKDNWLFVRGTFPPKPGSDKTKSHQQRISLKMRGNSREAIKQAEITARQIGLDLNLGKFDWAKFSDVGVSNATTVTDWIVKLEDWFWSNRPRNSSTENTWEKAYRSPLRKLPADAELTTQLLIDWVIENSTPHTRRRGHYCTCAKALSELADLPTEPFKKLGVDQPSRSVNPRDLPNDATIATTRAAIKDPEWQYVYGLMAAYGLRNHECFGLNFEDFPIVRVHKHTKTGSRAVKPLYPEWAEQWRLNEPSYPKGLGLITDPREYGSARLGKVVTQFFREEIGWSAYNLRHCYARRGAEFGIAPANMARLMGHTLFIHERTYKAWIGEKIYLDAVDRVMEGDRPSPPIV